ncbi:MAG: hypothetical protein KAQ94_03295 [Arcobacteraceae bacterium]|nr:hypothetical protein [Arcobacteraceae bacterium]
MTKIKIVGIAIFILSFALVIISGYIGNQNKINNSLLETINQQKAFTQEISKNIFYIYKNKNSSTVQLDESIKSFLDNMSQRDNTLNEVPSPLIKKQSEKIVILWNKFYLDVQKFRNQSKVTTAYTNIILETTVKDIYSVNLILIVEFDKLISIHTDYFHDILHYYKLIQYILFIVMSGLLIYLFTQIKVIIAFIQRFSQTSKKVIENSTIAQLEPMEIVSNNIEITKATNDFNFLVDKINNSIEQSTVSMQYTSQSLEQIENNIEEFLEFLAVINNDKDIDIQMTKKEDAVIESLEELMTSQAKLEDLKVDLNNLIKSHNLKQT